MRVNAYLQKLANVEESERAELLDTFNMQNYASNILSETDMWILKTAAENSEYLNGKLREAEDLTLDAEAPVEPSSEGESEELSLDTTSSEGESEELSLEPVEDGSDELSLDTPPAEDGSDDTTSSEEESPADGEEIETSLAGVGILPLIAEIQEKIAHGKPSEVELAALKAMKKMF